MNIEEKILIFITFSDNLLTKEVYTFVFEVFKSFIVIH